MNYEMLHMNFRSRALSLLDSRKDLAQKLESWEEQSDLFKVVFFAIGKFSTQFELKMESKDLLNFSEMFGNLKGKYSVLHSLSNLLTENEKKLFENFIEYKNKVFQYCELYLHDLEEINRLEWKEIYADKK